MDVMFVTERTAEVLVPTYYGSAAYSLVITEDSGQGSTSDLLTGA